MSKGESMKKRKPLTGDSKPRTLDQHAWWYEEPAGITLVVEARAEDGAYIATTVRTIPWRSIIASARRCGKLP